MSSLTQHPNQARTVELQPKYLVALQTSDNVSNHFVTMLTGFISAGQPTGPLFTMFSTQKVQPTGGCTGRWVKQIPLQKWETGEHRETGNRRDQQLYKWGFGDALWCTTGKRGICFSDFPQCRTHQSVRQGTKLGWWEDTNKSLTCGTEVPEIKRYLQKNVKPVLSDAGFSLLHEKGSYYFPGWCMGVRGKNCKFTSTIQVSQQNKL